MLFNIHVKNMALIQEVDIHLGQGLNILTGETGAGKSIIIGSVNVALGAQSFRGFVKDETREALVELIFTVEEEGLRKALEELEVPIEEDQVILTRKLVGGRTISKIGAETVPVSRMKKVAQLLIDIHGQHEHQSLLHKKNHLAILDEFAREKLQSLKEKNKKLYQEYMEKKKALAQMDQDEASRAKEADFLQFEIREIQEAELISGEDEKLERRFQKLSNARSIISAVTECYGLTGYEQSGAGELCGRGLRSLGSVLQYDEGLGGLSSQLSDIDNLLNDFNRELSAYMEELSFDEEDFHALEERLDLYNHLKAKYGNTVEKILAYKDEKEERLSVLQDYEAFRQRLIQETLACKEQLINCCETITGMRKRAAKALQSQIRDELIDLNFLDVAFEIQFETLSEPGANGIDEICFQISMNPGQPLQPLQEIASGGELSRIMLAIRTVLADKDATETLIFDEIDVGISGRTAQKVAEKLAVISKSRQVICITHLAQIAAMADSHYVIEKRVEEGNTQTSIRALSHEESTQELARILGGARITETVLESAREMKEMADRTKKY